jgi:hypothetical protein
MNPKMSCRTLALQKTRTSVWSENVPEKCTSHLLLIHVKPFSLCQNNNISKENWLIISHGTVLLICFGCVQAANNET